MWAAIGNLIAKLFALFLIRKGGADAERAKQSEATLETIERVNRPVSTDERDRLWAQNVAKFGGRVHDDSSARVGQPKRLDEGL